MQKEVVIIMGYPASGKTTLVKNFEAQGYVRLNRDDAGGSLSDLNNELPEATHSIQEHIYKNSSIMFHYSPFPLVNLNQNQ